MEGLLRFFNCENICVDKGAVARCLVRLPPQILETEGGKVHLTLKSISTTRSFGHRFVSVRVGRNVDRTKFAGNIRRRPTCESAQGSHVPFGSCSYPGVAVSLMARLLFCIG